MTRGGGFRAWVKSMWHMNTMWLKRRWRVPRGVHFSSRRNTVQSAPNIKVDK